SITGIRLWTGLTVSFASVVMIVHVSRGPPSPFSQRSHSPAKANGSPPWSRNSHGCFLPPRGWSRRGPTLASAPPLGTVHESFHLTRLELFQTPPRGDAARHFSQKRG